MPGTNRITASRPADHSKARLTDYIVAGDPKSPSRIFHYGQVVSSSDPKNANRLRIRIPLLDDPLYADSNGAVQDNLGDTKLPWAISSSGRHIDTPENNTVVVVALFDPYNPLAGRMWITAVPELSTTEIFDKTRMKDELTSSTWQNAEDSVGVKFNNSPELRNRPALASKSRQINYNVGVRGKDKNKLLFEQAKTTLVQNEGDKSNESKMVLTEKMLLASSAFEIIANDSTKKQTPVFADPLFGYLSDLEDIIDQTLTVLNTMPSMWMGTYPNTSNPQTATIVAQFAKVRATLQKIKIKGNGHSKYITVT